MEKVIKVEHDNSDYYLDTNGNLHREDGPAVEWFYADGEYGEWYKHGIRHRDDGPAVEFDCGCKEWWVNGQRH